MLVALFQPWLRCVSCACASGAASSVSAAANASPATLNPSRPFLPCTEVIYPGRPSGRKSKPARAAEWPSIEGIDELRTGDRYRDSRWRLAIERPQQQLAAELGQQGV